MNTTQRVPEVCIRASLPGETRRAIVVLLWERGAITPKTIAAHLGRNRSTVRRFLMRMLRDGDIARTRDGTRYFALPVLQHRERTSPARSAPRRARSDDEDRRDVEAQTARPGRACW